MDLYQSQNNLIYKAKSKKYAKIICKTIIIPNIDATSFGQNASFYDTAVVWLTTTILCPFLLFKKVMKAYIYPKKCVGCGACIA